MRSNQIVVRAQLRKAHGGVFLKFPSTRDVQAASFAVELAFPHQEGNVALEGIVVEVAVFRLAEPIELIAHDIAVSAEEVLAQRLEDVVALLRLTRLFRCVHCMIPLFRSYSWFDVPEFVPVAMIHRNYGGGTYMIVVSFLAVLTQKRRAGVCPARRSIRQGIMKLPLALQA